MTSTHHIADAGTKLPPVGGLVEVDGESHYRIDGVGTMEPFLVGVSSSADLWMWASSKGTLTAGRIDADHALFQYQTEDRIHRAVGTGGPITLIARVADGVRDIWQPFADHPHPRGRRSLAKSILGDHLVFEETHEDWGLRWRMRWSPSPEYGWVRTVELQDVGGLGGDYEVLDGLVDVMPAGVDARTEQLFSNLADAYKRSEIGPVEGVALYTVESLITDRAEPAEALTATMVWSFGEPPADLHLDERALGAMWDGEPFSTRDRVTGRPGAYLRRGMVHLESGTATSWSLVADTGLDHARVRDRIRLAGHPDASDRVVADIAAGRERLREWMAASDGFESTGDPIADAHHLSNVLFNAMRGGLFPHGRSIPVSDLLTHLSRWNRDVYERNHEVFAALGEWADVDVVRRTAEAAADPDLIRLVLEYLPLAFSRRHGDPSRPWNRFSINVGGRDGDVRLGYEGNWRDIFQNWEATLVSHPEFALNAVAKFVNASTADGHNPYRISHEGIDWEVPDPDDPWANIGYWGDHQIVYLHRLLRLWRRTDPDGPAGWMSRPVFVYADVPYRIADRPDMIGDPRHTITYDEDRAADIGERVRRAGSDGRLLTDARGDLVRVGLLEKLLIPALAKLTSLVPGGGIWMNTQRPEWNDANNALAGFGLSMVTLYHLHAYLRFLDDLTDESDEESVPLSSTAAKWMREVTDALERLPVDDCRTDDRLRRRFIDEVGAIGDRHRRAATTAFEAAPESTPVGDVRRLFRAAQDHLRSTIRAARGSDGLFESYNLVSFPSPSHARVDRLGLMLEGQVAVLSSDALDGTEVLAVIDALYASPLYRADQDSFMLYPIRELPSFLERNVIDADGADRTLLDRILAAGGVLVADRDGGLHFAPEMANAAALEAALDAIEIDGEARDRMREIYEEIFHHHAYTGRSGSMYGYEGIGSIYWHMVGKLLLAVQEQRTEALRVGNAEWAAGLTDAYRLVRDGLGFRKTPADFGAFPTDCYSHTPNEGGARQPGMTGQVKEEILARFGELGLRVEQGRVGLAPGLLPPGEQFAGGACRFTYCGVPFVVQEGATRHVVTATDGTSVAGDGLLLTQDVSRSLLGRRGEIAKVEFLGRDE